MMFHDEDQKAGKSLLDDLRDYFFKRCDITQKEYEELLRMAKDLSRDLLAERLKMMADFFYRLKKDHGTGKIHNEFAYAKKIILSDSFFENQKKDNSIPSVKETKKYLDDIQKNRREYPGVDKAIFHKRVEDIKKMYYSSFDTAEKANKERKYSRKTQEKTASVLKKLEEEDQITEIESKILSVFKSLNFCEMDYRMFKTVLLNIYLYYDKETLQNVFDRIGDKKNLSFKVLAEIRQSVVNQSEKEHSYDR